MHFLVNCFPSTYSGQPNKVQCAPPPKLVNGYQRPVLDIAGGAETIEFFCKNSYILSGNHQSICLSNGSWSSSPPKCVKGNCFQIHFRHFSHHVSYIYCTAYGTFHWTFAYPNLTSLINSVIRELPKKFVKISK